MKTKTTIRRLLFFLFLFTFATEGYSSSYGKLSPWLRHLVTQKAQGSRKAPALSQEVCAFVRISRNADEVMARYHSRQLAQAGNIYIANIPISELPHMAADERVVEIEASPSGKVLLDSMSTHLNALPIYAGTRLPQAYTGKGVVVGIMDIGFDLTHPNFYTRDGSQYRIKALWDMLSRDTIGSPFPVGRDFAGTEALLNQQHSTDGNDLTHGTHTLGIAAGCGYDSPYQGMAPESDICLVANAVSNNISYIEPKDRYKYTFATDALGFKYIFDYAKRVGRPCVISLSEGSGQDFWGYDQLYYEMLDSLVGPGRIIVAAAGNQGEVKSWIHKERGVESKGSFFVASSSLMTTAKSADDFMLRFVFYQTEKYDTIQVSTQEVLNSPDSVFKMRYPLVDSLEIQAYPSCYNPKDICYDITFHYTHSIGLHVPLSIEVVGSEADVEIWRVNGTLKENALNPLLNAAEYTHNIHTPSSAPCVISVGATTYRDSVVNSKGETCIFQNGDHGKRARMSSVGPTMDGRIKPDVMAPGINVISSYSSFYIATHPEADDARWNVAYYDYQGRTYAWNCNSGTSSSSPAVAGAIALWMQAKPDLTPDEAMDVIAHTSRHNEPSLTYPNNLYGYGELDAYRGLLYLLGIDHIDEISRHATPVRMSFSESGQLRLLFPDVLTKSMSVSIYQTTGIKILQTTLTPGTDSYWVNLPAALQGEVLVVQIRGDKAYDGSMLVRR